MNSTCLKIKVAIIEPVGGHGGMHFYDIGLSLGLLKNVDSVYLFSSNISTIQEEKNFFIYNSFNKVWATKSRYLLLIRYILSYSKSILIAYKEKCNIIHLHQFHFSFLLILNIVIAKLFFNKIVLTIHDIESFNESKIKRLNVIEKITYSMISKFIVHNKFSFDKLIGKLNSSKIEIIEHGNYIPFVRRISRKEKNDTFNILFFGQIKKVKGLDILLSGLTLLKNNYPNFMLTIAGRPWRDDFQYYNEIIEKKNLTKNVNVNLNYIPNASVYEYFNNTDLVVLPYKRIYQSGVLLLSMSYGRAVLASDLPPFSEIITDGVNGFLFHSEDEVSLSNKLSEIFNNIDKLKEIEKNAYTFIQENYDWYEIGKKTFKTYQNILI